MGYHPFDNPISTNLPAHNFGKSKPVGYLVINPIVTNLLAASFGGSNVHRLPYTNTVTLR